MKKIAIHLLRWAHHLLILLEYLLILLIGLVVKNMTHSELIADLTVVGLVGWLWFSEWRRQRARSQAHDLLARRLAVRINNALENTLRTPDFIILHIQEWPTSRMAEWPEMPQTPAPLRAWDVTVQVLDGSQEPEHLCIYLDAFLSVLPAVTSEDDQDNEKVSCVTRSCPCCPGTLHREHDDATPYQVHAYYTWKCDRCTYQDRADVLGNLRPCEQSQDRS